jgi:hypothetical protein
MMLERWLILNATFVLTQEIMKVYPMVKWVIHDVGRHQSRLVLRSHVMVAKSVTLISEYLGVYMASSWKQFLEAALDQDKMNVTKMSVIMRVQNNADTTATLMLDATMV